MAVSKHSADNRKSDRKKALKKLSRVELLEMLLDVSQENEKLRQENDELRFELEEKRIKLSESGSIAEAAMKLNDVFAAAQAAADQYVQSVKDKYYESVSEDEE